MAYKNRGIAYRRNGGNDRAIADESQATIELDPLLNAARTPSLTHRL